MLTVAEIMTREPYALGPENTLGDALQLMAEHHIRHIPILSAQQQLIGLVSQRDLLAASESSVASTNADHMRQGQPITMSNVMTVALHTMEETASLRGAAMHLLKNKLGCLPVTSEGRLTGIITDTDFVAIAINLMEQLEAAEPPESDESY